MDMHSHGKSGRRTCHRAASWSLAALAALGGIAAAGAAHGQWRDSFSASCVSSCPIEDPELEDRIVSYLRSLANPDLGQATELLAEACVDFCFCVRNAVEQRFTVLELAFDPMGPANWLASEAGREVYDICRERELLSPFQAQANPMTACTDEIPLPDGGTGIKLSDSEAFIYITENHEMDGEPLYGPMEAIQRALHLRLAEAEIAGKLMQLPDGYGVSVSAFGRFHGIADYSLILSIDNQRITGGLRQAWQVIAGKRIGDEVVLCGLTHRSVEGTSVWEAEFTAQIQVHDPSS